MELANMGWIAAGVGLATGGLISTMKPLNGFILCIVIGLALMISESGGVAFFEGFVNFVATYYVALVFGLGGGWAIRLVRTNTK